MIGERNRNQTRVIEDYPATNWTSSRGVVGIRSALGGRMSEGSLSTRCSISENWVTTTTTSGLRPTLISGSNRFVVVVGMLGLGSLAISFANMRLEIVASGTSAIEQGLACSAWAGGGAFAWSRHCSSVDAADAQHTLPARKHSSSQGVRLLPSTINAHATSAATQDEP